MHEDATIQVKRFSYEEPYHTQLEFIVSNGLFSGVTDFYCGVDRIREIGLALTAFPSKVPDEYRYVYGSTDSVPKFYRYFMLRAYTIDLAGHCALQFVMDLNQDAPDDGRCQLSIRTEAASIERLGQLFLRLHDRSPSGFRWTQYDDKFFPDAPIHDLTVTL